MPYTELWFCQKGAPSLQKTGPEAPPNGIRRRFTDRESIKDFGIIAINNQRSFGEIPDDQISYATLFFPFSKESLCLSL